MEKILHLLPFSILQWLYFKWSFHTNRMGIT